MDKHAPRYSFDILGLPHLTRGEFPCFVSFVYFYLDMDSLKLPIKTLHVSHFQLLAYSL